MLENIISKNHKRISMRRFINKGKTVMENYEGKSRGNNSKKEDRERTFQRGDDGTETI